jgi:chitodextrinase
VSSRTAVPALVVLTLALFPAGAQARAWMITYQPEAPVAGEAVAFHAERANPGNGSGESLVWDFGDGGTGATADATHVYSAEGEYTVTLTTPELDGSVTVEDSVVVQVASPPPPPPPPPPPNTPPSAAFTFSPAGPLVGEGVTFTGGSDPDGDPITREWDFGDFTPVSSDVAPTHAYTLVGSYTVALTVTDDRGGFASTSQDVTVAPQPQSAPPADPGGTNPPAGSPIGVGTPAPTPAPRRMKPFPIVRIAGLVLPDGALVRILSVRAPRGASVLVRCRGRGCPARAVARSSSVSIVRFHRFERRLPAGVRLELFVRKPRRVGKYTRLLIRAGKPPARVDRCLMPGRPRPVRCP